MEALQAANGAVKHTQMTFKADRRLAIEGDELVLYENASTASKSSSRLWLGGTADPVTKHTIPLYNVLWAEVKDGELTVDYAKQTSKSAIDNERWTLDIIDEPTNEEPTDLTPQRFCEEIISKAYGAAPTRRRALVLINPNSGPGHGVKKWETVVRPLFDAARLTHNAIILNRGGEAMELVEKINIDDYDTIVACSGDGTPHEIFNGLARRPDAKTALGRIAVSHIPCGSGNAFSCNLYGSYRPGPAALAIIKGVVTPLDLVSITQKGERVISFLSQSLGIIAESDLGTEHLRWMGSARFDVGVMSRVFLRKCYPCDISIKLVTDKKEDVKRRYKEGLGQTTDLEVGDGEPMPALRFGTETDEVPVDWETVSYDKIGNFYCGNMAYMAPDLNFFSASLPSDGCMDMVAVNGNLWPITALKIVMSVESNQFFDNEHVEYKKVEAYRITPRDQKDGYISIDGEKLPFAPYQAEVHRGLGRVISKSGRFEAPGPNGWEKVSAAQ